MAISASIQALIAGEQVAGSKLNSKLRDELLAEGMLLVISHGSRKSYRARDTEALKRFLIDKDESFRILEIDASDSRASMAIETGNSKLAMVRSCPGFPVNSYEPIECSLDGKPFMVNPQEGSFLFVAEWEMFTIPEDVVVLGIENILIPDDIETRLNSGSRKRYDEQYSRYKGITSDVCELQQLIDLICQKRKAYDQEGYILKG